MLRFLFLVMLFAALSCASPSKAEQALLGVQSPAKETVYVKVDPSALVTDSLRSAVSQFAVAEYKEAYGNAVDDVTSWYSYLCGAISVIAGCLGVLLGWVTFVAQREESRRKVQFNEMKISFDTLNTLYGGVKDTAKELSDRIATTSTLVENSIDELGELSEKLKLNTKSIRVSTTFNFRLSRFYYHLSKVKDENQKRGLHYFVVKSHLVNAGKIDLDQFLLLSESGIVEYSRFKINTNDRILFMAFVYALLLVKYDILYQSDVTDNILIIAGMQIIPADEFGKKYILERIDREAPETTDF